jgi:hypothetical protein
MKSIKWMDALGRRFWLFWDWWNLERAWNGLEILCMSRIIVNVNKIFFHEAFDLLLGHVFMSSYKLAFPKREAVNLY